MFAVKINDKKNPVMGLLLAALVTGISDTAQAVPSFGRQTGMECSACRTIFPQLTPFGREFKQGAVAAVGCAVRTMAHRQMNWCARRTLH